MSATTLELFFIDGKPDGMLTAEMFGWTGHVLVTPRTRLVDALKRPQSSFTGVYILLGEDDEEPMAYIGEGESISARIKTHDSKKDWWTKAVLITSTSDNLNKAHVQYLEARLVQEGQNVANTKLENGVNPSLPSLSEGAQANMEEFISKLLMILPAIRVDLFVNNAKVNQKAGVKSSSSNHAPIFELTLKKEGIVATAEIINGDFVVKKGSLARSEYTGDRSEKSHYWKFHDKLVEKGILANHGKHRIFTTDYVFSSTSAAGAVCNGRSTAGPTAWKIKGTDKTYRQWEEENLQASE